MKVVSLFSGCGGMDIGVTGNFDYLGEHYQSLPFNINQAIDFDEKIVSIYNQNFNKRCQARDILTVKNKEVVEHDILLGGFPCQSFSIVAQNPKRLGYKDKRGQLFFEMCRILRSKKPRFFIAENVKGILSANKGEAFDLIIKEFEKSGYYVKYQLLNASHYGVPQKRERVFIIGFRRKADYKKYEFPTPTTLNQPRVLEEVIFPESEIGEKYYFSANAVNGMKKTKHARSMSKGRSQDIMRPCNTVGAHLAKVSLNSTDPVLKIGNRYRMFTPREVARIQSFPETYKLSESRPVNYKALGNAVPPVLMWHVAKSLTKII